MKILLHSLLAIALVAANGEFATVGALAQPAGPLLIPCKYPNGWNSTDAARDVNGTPPGYGHECVVEYYPPDLIRAPCGYREVFSSINWSRILDQPGVRVEYRCAAR